MKDMFGEKMVPGDIVCYYQSNKGLSMNFGRVVCLLERGGVKVLRLAKTSSEGCELYNDPHCVSTIKSGANALIIRDQKLINKLSGTDENDNATLV